MRYLLCLLLFVFTVNMNAQRVSFDEFSTGIIEYTYPLENENKEVIGYALIYNKGLDETETKIKYEYVLLDKNLGKLTNGDFQLDYNKKLEYYLNEVKFNNNQLYISFLAYKEYDYYGLIHHAIDLKSKEIKSNKFFKEFEVQDAWDLTNLKKNKPSFFQYAKFNLKTIADRNNVYFLGKTGYYLPSTQYDFFEFSLYNNDYKNILSFGETEMDNGKIREFFNGGIVDDEFLFYSVEITDHKKLENQLILQEGIKKINLKTGEHLYNFAYNTSLENFSMPRLEQNNHKLYVIGQVKTRFSNLWRSVYRQPTVAIRRTILDEKGNVELDKTLNLKDIFPDFGTNDEKDDDGFKYSIKEAYNFDDSSFIVLFERYKFPKGPSNRVISDYFVIHFDALANVINTTLLDKKNQFSNDNYLFSQVDKTNNEVIFYYKDSNKAKEYSFDFIYSNKVKDGKVTQDKIDIKTEKHSVKIKNAKYGYFLLIDLNDKNIPLGMRLEKTN